MMQRKRMMLIRQFIPCLLSRTTIALALILSLGFKLNAQFTQDFNSPSLIYAAGWAKQNLSSPLGTSNWFTGDPVVFPAFNGADTTYIAANFNNGAGTAAISDWLFTPIQTISNGSVLTFRTRTVNTPTFPDRLEVRMSLSGASLNVGATATSTGDFATVLVTVNSGLTTAGYPNVWTQYTITISGVGAPTSGRFAFRYFVPNGGPSGANSDYIGIDNVTYTIPSVGLDAVMATKDSLEYTLVPQRQQDPNTFNGRIQNGGTSSLTNVYMNVRIKDAGNTIVYNQNSATVPSLAASATANFTTPGTTALVPGAYTIEYIAKHSTADASTLNDTLRNFFQVTADEYARDNGLVTGNVGIGAGIGGYIGEEFQLFQSDIIDSVGVYYNGGYVGRKYALAIWSMTGAGVPNVIIARTDTLLYPDNLARYYRLPIRGGGVGLAPGTYMISAIEFDSTLLLGTTDQIFTPGDMWVDWPTNPFAAWTNIEAFGTTFQKASVIRPDLAFNSFTLNTMTTTPSGCSGNTGTASIQVLGGSAQGATYLWSNGQTTATATGLAPGSYSVTVTLYGVKTLTATGTVTGGGSSPTINSVNAGIINCNGGTATLTPNVSGGSPGYTYLWSNGATSTTITVVAGTYIVTVTDIATCTAVSQPITLTQPAVLTTNISSNAQPCVASTATLTANVNGGTSGYSYLWSNGATTSAITVGVGTYTVTVTDSRGCTAVSSPSTISTGTPPSVSITPGSILCAGGTATLGTSVTGGTSGFSFAWSNSGSGASITAGAGTYTVTVTDAVGCTGISQPVTLTQPTAISSNASAGTILCNGGTTVLSASASGGTGSLQYLWSNGGTASTTTVQAGTYTLTITDANGCTSSPAPTTVAQPAVINPVISGSNILCNGGNSTLSANITGGTGAYNYNWSNGGSAATTVVAPGTYTLTVTDANGCTATSNTVTVTSPAPLVCTVTNGNIACNGGMATISTSTTGGVGSYLYQWSNGATTSSIQVSSGSYTVTVTDANGCTTVAGPTTVSQPATVSASIAPATILCNGGTVTLNASATGGTGAFSFAWSIGGSGSTLTVGAGTYTVLATDANGCTGTSAPITLTEPTAISATVNSTPASSATASDGTATALVTGGSPGYTYLWSNGSTASTATGLPPGTHAVTITDANGCTFVATSNVLVGIEGSMRAAEVTVSPSPNNGNFEVQVSTTYPVDMTLNIMDAAGRIVATRNVLQTAAWTTPISLENANGVYLVEVLAGTERITKRIVVTR
jgi:hypothetical protein